VAVLFPKRLRGGGEILTTDGNGSFIQDYYRRGTFAKVGTFAKN
jgi:hypothetical protein